MARNHDEDHRRPEAPDTLGPLVMSCCVCERPMKRRLALWGRYCQQCGTWASTLDVRINVTSQRHLDEARREPGLVTLRDRNNAVVLRRLRRAGLGDGAKILDVGSGHGWFVEAADKLGYDIVGIEPDAAMVAASAARGVAVRHGYFPDDVPSAWRFDAICFNDTLEHFADPRACLRSSIERLAPGGLISFNMPNSGGIMYRLALLAKLVGVSGTFDRLWQVGLPSPHLWYLDRPGVERLAADMGLAVCFSGSLDSVSRTGLWPRVHLDRQPSLATASTVGVVWALAPLLNQRHLSDVMHVVARGLTESP
jgi:SAM-dependent methyltransferase